MLRSTVSLWAILTLSGPGASLKTAFFGYVNMTVPCLATILGIPTQFNAIQYNRSATNSTFRKIIMFSLLTLSEKR